MPQSNQNRVSPMLSKVLDKVQCESDLNMTIKPLIYSGGLWPSYQNRICDCCVLIVHCPNHNRIALCNSTSSNGKHYRWFPYSYMLPNLTWHQVLLSTIFLILGQQSNMNIIQVLSCLNLFRLQLPRTQRFITRMIYYVRIDHKLFDPCSTKSKINSLLIEWVTLQEAVKNQINNLWGPEVSHYAQVIERKQPIKQTIVEYSVKEAFSVFPIRDAPQNREEEMLSESKVNEKDVERIYDDYIEHCFPCFFMNQVSFKSYMLKHGIETDDDRLTSYFNSFRFLEKPYMSFHELLIGLVAIDRETFHCETRLKIIFRFYDHDLDGYLNRSEFYQLIQDLHPKNMPPETIESKVNSLLSQIKQNMLRRKSQQPASLVEFGKNVHHKARRMESMSSNFVDNKVRIGFKSFFKAVRKKILIGTSKLCRSKVWICATIARALITRRIRQTFSKQYSFKRIVTNQKHEPCESCMALNAAEPYKLASNIVLLGENKQFKLCHRLKDPARKRFPIDLHSVEIQFNTSALPNLYMMLIRSFNKNKIKGTIQDYKGLFEVVPESLREQFVVDIETICSQVEQIVERESRFVEIRSPAFVVGDIHGNLEDLMTLETSLWPGVPFLSGNNYLFLGDYVDRGRWSFECAIYLFCFKMLAPNQVTLLRGNHEVRSVQRAYSYETELIKKYGQEFGSRFYEITNQVFDRLPCSAIVDNSVFCAHGGIPYSAIGKPIRSLESSLMRVSPTPELSEPNIIWEILWSDPVEDKYLREEFEFLTDVISRKITRRSQATTTDAVIQQLYQVGYLPNRKRGTGYLFNEYAFGTFLAVNSLSHMIRAHEVPVEGYRLNFRSRCITVFSCSHYCGVDNECAVVMLQDNRVRIVQLDTFNNSPATD